MVRVEPLLLGPVVSVGMVGSQLWVSSVQYCSSWLNSPAVVCWCNRCAHCWNEWFGG